MESHNRFSKADSLTEVCLGLQDTLLQVWNTMIHDDNRKVRALHHLVNELRISHPEKKEDLDDYEKRLDELLSMRYDQRSMSDPEVVTEYDFASGSLVTELTALAESLTEYTRNTSLQKLVESIRQADQRVMNYRAEYDDIASRFNLFIEHNYDLLGDIYADTSGAKVPLFQMAAD